MLQVKFWNDGQCRCLPSLVECNGECIDPKSSTPYCGAKDDCTGDNKGIECIKNQTCFDGECVTFECDDGLQLCPDPENVGKNLCININEGDVNNCGACGYNCNPNKYSNAKLTGCLNNECQYACDDNFINCGLENKLTTEPYCLTANMINSHPLHCTTCHKPCKPEEYCNKGCKLSVCGGAKACPTATADGCGNTDVKCGVNCNDCTNLPNIAQGKAKCDNGVCRIEECTTDYYIFKVATGDVCKKTSPQECALPTSATPVNCSDFHPNAETTICDKGECKATKCNAPYILKNGQCIDP